MKNIEEAIDNDNKVEVKYFEDMLSKVQKEQRSVVRLLDQENRRLKTSSKEKTLNKLGGYI